MATSAKAAPKKSVPAANSKEKAVKSKASESSETAAKSPEPPAVGQDVTYTDGEGKKHKARVQMAHDGLRADLVVLPLGGEAAYSVGTVKHVSKVGRIDNYPFWDYEIGK